MPSTISIEEIGEHLGQTIEDSMGRIIGRLISITTNQKDEIQALQVAHSNGEVTQYAVHLVKLVNDHPVILQDWRVDAEDMRKEYEIIKRRKQALDQLLKDGDIQQTEYNQLRCNWDDLTKGIMTKRDEIVETVKQVEGKLEHQIRDLQNALTNNKMLYTEAEIDEHTYRTVTESIRADLEITRKETKDAANTREYLQTIATLEESKTTPSAPTNFSIKIPDIPEVVVIKIKEPT